MAEFRNESGLEFTDISSEEWRIYHWQSGYKIIIRHPLRLHVSASGGHRVFYLDKQGQARCRYIRPTFDDIEWLPKEGQPHFVK